MNREEFIKYLCEVRGIKETDICNKCSGTGIRTYANTSTWLGGIGGQILTSDICDKCWGSGNQNKPWTNLRLLRSILTQEQIDILRKGNG